MGLKVESSTRFRASLGVPNSQRCATGEVEMIHGAPYISCFQSFDFQRGKCHKPPMKNDLNPPVFHPFLTYLGVVLALGLPHCKPHRMQIQALRSFFGWLSCRPTAERVPLERLAVDENWWNQSQVVANDPPADKTVVNNECLQALDTIIGGWCSLGCFLSSHFDQISMLQYLFGTETLSNFPFPNVGSECLGIRDQVSPVGFAYKQHRIFGSFSGAFRTLGLDRWLYLQYLR